LVSKDTDTLLTPGTALTAFSTLAEQAAQVMPVTLYCFRVAIGFPPVHRILFISAYPILYREKVFVKKYKNG
jgi:hypothetical protein